MTYIYPAIFHSENNGFWAEFPDLDGCFSQGDSEQDAFYNASESLKAYIETFLAENKPLPKPSCITQIKIDSASFTSFISCIIINKEKYIKKTLTIPVSLNKKAEAAGINFSKLLKDAITAKLSL